MEDLKFMAIVLLLICIIALMVAEVLSEVDFDKPSKPARKNNESKNNTQRKPEYIPNGEHKNESWDGSI
jgi:hypothetical protein